MEILRYVNRVNLSIIFGLCFAANSFSLVEAREVGQYGGNVTLGTNPTTTYRYINDQDIPTRGTPGRDIQVRGGAKFQGKLIGNGPNLHQTVGGGVTIEGLKGETKLAGKAKFSKKGAAKGLSRGLKFGKLGGPWGFAITTGVALAIDKLIEEDGQKVPDRYEFNENGDLVGLYDDVGYYGKSDGYYTAGNVSGSYSNLSELKSLIQEYVITLGYKSPFSIEYFDEYNNSLRYSFKGFSPSEGKLIHLTFITYRGSQDCGYGSSWDGYGCWFDSAPKELLVDDSIIALTDSIDLDILFDKWSVKDYEQIFPYIDEEPILELEVPDSIIHDIETSVFTGSDGEQYHVENISRTDFSSDGLGGFTSQTSEIQNVYKDGVLVDTQLSSSSGNVTGQGSSSSVPQPSPEIPTDCDLFPSQCRHNEWVETPMDTPPPHSSGDFSDLGVDVTLDDVQGVDVNFGEASCPAPIFVDLIIFEPVEITFYFMCEHAKSAKPFILISASLFALYIVLGSNRGKA